MHRDCIHKQQRKIHPVNICPNQPSRVAQRLPCAWQRISILRLG